MERSTDNLLFERAVPAQSAARPGCPPANRAVSETISGFPRYQRSIAGLPARERQKLDALARLVANSYAPGCRPIRAVHLVGHADRDFQRGFDFENRISGERALVIQMALADRIDRVSSIQGRGPDRNAPALSSLLVWRWAAAGASKLLVQNPRTERERTRNRRVEIFLSPRLPGPDDVRDPRIDVDIQNALLRCLSCDAGARADALALLETVKKGWLAGIYADDRQEARRSGATFPPGSDAVLVWHPEGPGRPEPPMIVFRRAVASDTRRLDMALRRALGLFRAAGALRPDPAAPGAGRGGSGAVAEFSLSNLSGFVGGGPLSLPLAGISLGVVRTLDTSEIRLASGVFGASLDFSRILVSPALGLGGAPFTLAVPAPSPGLPVITVLNLGPGPFGIPASNQPLLIHELTHSWQSQHHINPMAYEGNSVASQLIASRTVGTSLGAYCYVTGKGFSSYAAEQIAEQVENCFTGTGGTHEKKIRAHISAVPVGLPDPLNMLSLAVPRWERPGDPGVSC